MIQLPNPRSRCMRKQLKDVIAALILVALLSVPGAWSSTSAGATKTVQSNHRTPKIWGVRPNIDTSFGIANRWRNNAQSSSTPKHIIVMGGPASGKGTQCQNLVEKYGLVHLSTGDMLRQAVSSSSVDDDRDMANIKRCMENGQLIPDDVIIRLVLQRLNSSDCQQRGWILDGFPRTANQARALQKAGIDPDLFLFLNVPDEVAIERACGRRTDPVTGKGYHLDYSPPPSDEVRQRLVIRSDDHVESMTQRLKQFRENANAIKDCFDKDIIVDIDGRGTPDEVLDDIISCLSNANKNAERV